MFFRIFLVIFFIVSMPSYGNKAPLVIGLDADISAVAAEGGVAIQRGAQIAIDEINQNGGVLGHQLTLVTKDHRGNPARGLANINYFAQLDNVVAVLGGVHTPVALHELPAIHQHEIIYLGPWAAGTPVVDNGYEPNYVFRLSVRDQHAGRVLASHAKKRNFSRVGLLLERTGWGRSNEKSMTAAAQDLGLEITGTEWFNWREIDMSVQINRLIETNVDVIFLVANAPEGAAIIKNMSLVDKNKQVPIFSHWGLAGGSFVKKVGLDLLKTTDLTILQTYSFLAPSNKEKMKHLLSQYQNKFDSSITAETVPAAVGVVHAYDLVHMLVQAIQQANSIDMKKIRDELENIKSYYGVFKHFTYPFTKDKHDALSYDDYIMATYNSRGYLIPIEE